MRKTQHTKIFNKSNVIPFQLLTDQMKPIFTIWILHNLNLNVERDCSSLYSFGRSFQIFTPKLVKIVFTLPIFRDVLFRL